MIKRCIPLVFIPLLGACFSSELEFTDQYEPVVEAYLYVEQAVDDIYLSSMISFGSDSSGGEAITNARGGISRSDESWMLQHNDSLPGNYYLEYSPEFSPGDSVQLLMELDDVTITATTVIPGPPPAVKMSSGSIYIPRLESMSDMRGMEWPDPVELTWENPEGRYFFLDIQNIEAYPQSIRPDAPEGMPGPGGFAFQMITRPTNDTYYAIEAMHLEYYGTHRIIFTSVNDEYAYLYNSLNQDSRELNEPFSNIDGGLGIFTAFNSDTLYLEVVPIY